MHDPSHLFPNCFDELIDSSIFWVFKLILVKVCYLFMLYLPFLISTQLLLVNTIRDAVSNTPLSLKSWQAEVSPLCFYYTNQGG